MKFGPDMYTAKDTVENFVNTTRILIITLLIMTLLITLNTSDITYNDNKLYFYLLF
jgi:hypothetical protein